MTNFIGCFCVLLFRIIQASTLTARTWDTDGYGNHMIPSEAGASSTYQWDDFFENSDAACPADNC